MTDREILNRIAKTIFQWDVIEVLESRDAMEEIRDLMEGNDIVWEDERVPGEEE